MVIAHRQFSNSHEIATIFSSLFTTSIDSGFCCCCCRRRFCGCAPEINRPARSNTIKSVYWLQQLKLKEKYADYCQFNTSSPLLADCSLSISICCIEENCNNTIESLKLFFLLYFKMKHFMCMRLKSKIVVYCTFYLEHFERRVNRVMLLLLLLRELRNVVVIQTNWSEMRYFILDMQIIYEEFNVTHWILCRV